MAWDFQTDPAERLSAEGRPAGKPPIRAVKLNAHERISSLLRATHGNDSCGHQSGIIDQITGQLAEDGFGVPANRLSDRRGISSSGNPAYGQLQALLKERIQCRAAIGQ